MKRILVVDDTAFIRSMLKEIIEEAGFVHAGDATNGKEGVEKYIELKPDLVLLDITMPEMDGMAALEEIMRIDPKANVIMCSAMGQKDLVLKAISMGAKEFIVKPFQKDRMIEAIKATLL